MVTVPEDADRGVSAEGLLFVEVECPAELETEFHAWYNLEHVPERLRIPGFLSGHRYAAVEGRPRWLAAYRLASLDALESSEYRQWMGPLQTPWTKRMVSSTAVRRSVFRRVHSVAQGEAASGTSGLLAVRFAPAGPESKRLHDWHDQVFSSDLVRLNGVVEASHYEDTETFEQLALYYLTDPWVTQQQAFGREWVAGWERKRDSLASWQRTIYVRIL